ncbi:phenylacetate--CoA ligase family protein [Anaerosporobacter faecicola]|uniref:phenylacetate--CoA ligase family protein n=1 Tax=Anaerosporobacter faecicola TaxID=2718714 RepID=UPI00143B112B|nr:phenylacetate--CoA ligase [Anaerosporobacter faecicola]
MNVQQELLNKLNSALNHAGKSKFYQNKGLQGQVESIEDFQQIPPTTKEDLRNCDPLDVLSVDMGKIQEYHESFGTTGKPVPVWYSRYDMDQQVKQLNSPDLDVKETDIVMIRFPYAISIPAHIFSRMFIEEKATIIPVSRGSLVTPYTRVIEMLKRLKVTILACNPTEAIVLADVVKKLGLDPKNDFAIRAICVAGELLCLERKQIIEELWGCEVFVYGGSTEAANVFVSCKKGHLHCHEDFYIEVVDPQDTTKIRTEGKGLMLITLLNKEAFPLIRYNTGDLVELHKNTCDCRLSGDILIHHGREVDQITIGDNSATMLEIQTALYQKKELGIVKYWKMKQEQNELVFYVEGEVEKASKEITLNLPFPNRVHIVEVGTIQNIEQLLVTTELRKASYIM